MKFFINQLAKTILPNRYYLLLQKLYRKLYHLGTSHYCPICKSYLREFLPHGVKPRPNALCPICGSLERHRLVWLFMRQKTNLFFSPRKRMLHVAPEGCLTTLFQKSKVIDYLSVDLLPRAMLQADLTQICFPNETFDVVYASHVLQEIPDDRKAMREILRILKTNGWAILQVPINAEFTYEAPAVADSKEREQLFGDPNARRFYGNDYYDRLREAGFTVHREKLLVQKKQSTTWRLGLIPNEEITFCTKE